MRFSLALGEGTYGSPFKLLLLVMFLAGASCSMAAPGSRSILPAISPGKSVTDAEMQRVYETVKTPFKHGVIIRGDQGKPVDCPNVFRHGNSWYMMYVCMNKVGYETHLTRSDDLLRWETLGKVLTFQRDGWDRWQADGGIALCDPTWGGTHELQTFDGKYWMSYIGGALQGYETDPLAIGMAWTKNPDQAREWTRISENPVLSRDQPDTRPFEKQTLYKSQIIWDKAESLGFPFIMFYNGKIHSGYEKIGMAVSRDMVHWHRYGDKPVISNGDEKQQGISGDPQIVRIEDLWVMFYFGAFWKPGAFDTFACSRDLVHWTQWKGRHLIEPSEPWDKQYAHKPWVLKHDDVVYHYYCAVGNQGRVIALATSKEIPPTVPSQVANRPTLYLIGDSTVNNGTRGQMGWGTALPRHFALDRITVANRARGGRSSRTFFTEGLWSEVSAALKPGDFVLIQFGHNDGGSLRQNPARASLKGIGEETQEVTDAKTGQKETIHTFGWYLRKYVQDAKAKGAVPIVASLVPRNIWKDAKVARSSGDYGRWAEEVAKAENAFFINLNEITASRYEALGEKTVAAKFFAATDHTHTTKDGAEINAECVIEGIRALKDCPLGKFVLPVTAKP